MDPTQSRPFSDLTIEQIQSLMQAARVERAEAVRDAFAALFRTARRVLAWPARQREAQVRTPHGAPALNLTVYR